MAIPRNDIPRNADCRGGVFAVFAKIPPPILFAVFWSATRHATSLQTPPAPVSRFAVAGRLGDLPPKRRRKPPVVRVRHRRLRVDIYSGPRRR